MNVLVFPLFVDEYPNTDFTRVEGEELVLDCSVEGNPPPKVSLNKNDKIISCMKLLLQEFFKYS